MKIIFRFTARKKFGVIDKMEKLAVGPLRGKALGCKQTC